jgi:hypothetical protein
VETLYGKITAIESFGQSVGFNVTICVGNNNLFRFIFIDRQREIDRDKQR